MRFSILVVILLVAGCASTPAPKQSSRTLAENEYEVFGKVYQIMPSSLGYREIGIASWYGTKFHGRPTAMGETYDMHGLTAAHKSLPLPTAVKVTNLDNGQHIVLRVNDRGPFHEDRVIDLSYAAAKALGFENDGTAPVVVEALDRVNYPELAPPEPAEPSIYLQVGAYSMRKWAEQRLTEVRDVLSGQAESRILESESETGSLYKVWVGPMQDEVEGSRIAALMIESSLGNPLRVVVD